MLCIVLSFSLGGRFAGLKFDALFDEDRFLDSSPKSLGGGGGGGFCFTVLA